MALPMWNPRLMQQQPMGGSPYGMMNAAPNPFVQPGTIMRGPDGRNYQYAETTGMAGATGNQGWIPTSMSPRGGGLSNFLSDNSGGFIALGAGMLTGQTGAGLTAFGQQLGQNRQRSKTLAWLKQNHPEYADAYAAGVLDPKTVGDLMFKGAEAPKTVKTYDADGNEIVQQWVNGQWQQLGGVKSTAMQPQDALKQETEISKAYRSEKDVEAYQEVRNGYEKVRAAASQNSGPGDISLLVGYMKMLDPGSVVREGEFATAESAGGAARQYINLYNKLLTGERLTPEMRAEFVQSADKIYQETAGNLRPTNKVYSDRAGRYGVNSDFIVQPEEYKPIDFGNMQPGQKTEKNVGGKTITIERVE